MNEQLVVSLLSIACVILAGIVAVMAMTVPFLWWQVKRLDDARREADARVALVDEAVSRLCEAAGVPKAK